MMTNVLKIQVGYRILRTIPLLQGSLQILGPEIMMTMVQFGVINVNRCFFLFQFFENAWS